MLRALDGWTTKSGVGEVMLTPPDDGPVLSIRTSTIDGGLNDSDLRRLARDLIEDGHEPEEVELGDFKGLAFRYVEGDVYWRHWYLRAAHIWLEVGYDCTAPDRGKHDEEIDGMLRSLAIDVGAI